MKELPEVNFRKNFMASPEIEIITFRSLRTLLKTISNHNPFKPHQLKFNVLLVVTEGKKGFHDIDFKAHRIQERSVILIAKDQIHRFVDIPNSNEGYLIMFTERLLLEIGANYPFIIGHLYNNQLYNPVHTLNSEQFEDLHNLVLTIINKMRSKKKSIKVELVQSYFQILLLEIFACRERRTKQHIIKGSKTEEFIRFQFLLKENHIKEKKVKFYAQQMNITPKALNSIVQSIVNRTAKEFILSYLILEAKKLLLMPNFSTKEVAYRLGFKEPTNFTKFFKTHTKILPSEFAKTN